MTTLRPGMIVEKKGREYRIITRIDENFIYVKEVRFDGTIERGADHVGWDSRYYTFEKDKEVEGFTTMETIFERYNELN